MEKPIIKKIWDIEQLKALVRRGRTPFTAKTVLVAGAIFICSLLYWLIGWDKDMTGSWSQQAAPGTMKTAGSYLGGFFIGWGVRRSIKITSVLATVFLAVTGLFILWGWDGSIVQSWINSSNEWLGQNIEGAKHYLVSLLPSSTAAGIGGVLGFRSFSQNRMRDD